jgi:hypothetical protein
MIYRRLISAVGDVYQSQTNRRRGDTVRKPFLTQTDVEQRR